MGPCLLAERLQNLIFAHLGSMAASGPEDACSGSGLLRRAETFGGYDSAVVVSAKSKECGVWVIVELWDPD